MRSNVSGSFWRETKRARSRMIKKKARDKVEFYVKKMPVPAGEKRRADES